MNLNAKIYDGATEIIFSGVYNVYEAKLTIKPILDFEVNFILKEDGLIQGSQIETLGNNDTKTLTITLINFSNSLGVGTTSKLPILTDDDGKQVFFSVHVTALGSNSTLRQVVVTFYKAL